MKITNKTLMVEFQTEVKLGNNNAIELTLIHNAFISEGEGGCVEVDLDLGVDLVNVKFLGIDIDSSYNGLKQFKANLKELGIDFDKLVEEKEREIIDSGIEDKLRLKFRDKV